MTISDHELVQKLKQGDDNAFNIIYKNYHSRIFYLANSYVRNSFVSASLVQDAFMALWETREKLTSDTNVAAYLLTIVKNKALNHLNQVKIKAKAEESIQNHFLRELELRCDTLYALNPEQMFRADVEVIVKRTIESLPFQCRKAILLSRFEGFSNKEIAEMMNISVKGVEYHITKALKTLRVNLKDYLTGLIILFINILY